MVLLEPALGGFSLQYARIQPAVAEFTRVMAYDRAGQGWSDTSANPRTPCQLANELSTLLNKLDLHPPYVLVGHSFGGLLTRVYAGLYPEEVAGIVLVDSTHVDEYDAFPDIDKSVHQMAVAVRVLKAASHAGLGKLLTRISLGGAAKAFSREDFHTFLEVASQPKHHETMLAEYAQHRCYYGPRSEVPGSLGDIPLIVVTAGNSVSGPGKVGGLSSDQVNALHQKLQKNLVRLSSRGEQIVIPGATHFSILTQPEHAVHVVHAIRQIVDRVRRELREN